MGPRAQRATRGKRLRGKSIQEYDGVLVQVLVLIIEVVEIVWQRAEADDALRLLRQGDVVSELLVGQRDVSDHKTVLIPRD